MPFAPFSPSILLSAFWAASSCSCFARSFKIQGVLKKMHQTFSINLKDAQDAEAKAIADYDKLTSAKQEQLDAAQKALNKMEGENGAKGMSRQESVDERDALKTQVANDEKFIKQTEKALADKKASWKVRSELRAGELGAISKAIYILHNDDARDLFKKSFASQGFLQVKQTMHKAMAHRVQKAAAALKDAAFCTRCAMALCIVCLTCRKPWDANDFLKRSRASSLCRM
jgi:hypothetical protein